MQAAEDVDVGVYFARIDFVEEDHHDEGVEEKRVVRVWSSKQGIRETGLQIQPLIT